MKKLVVISAPSGAGKTTLCQRLLSEFPQLCLSISSTTRAPRGQEVNGREYHFLTAEQFKAQIDAGRFAEWAEVFGRYYGTSKDTLEAVFAQNRAVLLDIDILGAEQLRRAYPDEILRVFIAPPAFEVLGQRLRARGTETEEKIQERLARARRELDASAQFDHVIVNDDLERAYGELRAIVAPAVGG